MLQLNCGRTKKVDRFDDGCAHTRYVQSGTSGMPFSCKYLRQNGRLGHYSAGMYPETATESGFDVHTRYVQCARAFWGVREVCTVRAAGAPYQIIPCF